MTAHQIEYQAIVMLSAEFAIPDEELVCRLQSYYGKNVTGDEVRRILKTKPEFKWLRSQNAWTLNDELYDSNQLKFILKQLYSGGKW